MSDKDRTKNDLQKELKRLHKRILELESRGAGDRCSEELEIREQAIRSSINGIALSDINGMLTFVNPSFLAMWGYEDASEVLGRPAASFWESGEQAERIIQALGERGGWIGEMTAKRKNGDRFPVQLSATMIRGRTGTPLGMMGSFLDITERKRAEERLGHITRLYALLSQINQAIVRTRDRDELFRAVCQVAVEFGGFKMAWTGLVDEATGIVRPVAHAGQEAGYLEMLAIRTGDRPEGKGPTGSALREGTLVICDDIATDPRMLPWRDEALKRGYRSSAAVPFSREGRSVGTLNLYATEPGFFTDDERKLLEEIGVDISFALDNLESEQERKRVEDALLESRERYRSFFENAAVAVALVDQDGRVVEANDADCRFLGYPRSELIGMHFTQFTHPQDLDVDVNLYRSLMNGERQGYEIEKRYIRKDGEVVWGRVSVSLIHDSQGSPLYTSVVCSDITDRKRTEASLRESEERLNYMMSNSPAVIYTCRPSGDFGATFVSENVVHQLGYEASAFIADPGFWTAQIHPEDKQRIFDGLAALF
ncbi:MAG: PAS domain S-box protein, partial [Nitrospirae bacterium]|nr:PAS domain S-box protein [Nitrospirota bacterium]